MTHLAPYPILQDTDTMADEYGELIVQFTALMNHLDDVYGRDTRHLAQPTHWHVDHIDDPDPSYIYYTDRADAVAEADEAPAIYNVRECTDPACTEEE